MKTGRRILGAMAMIFGAVTLLEGGKALLGIFFPSGPVGNFPLFIVGPNFLSGFAYLGIGFGFFSGWKSSARAAVILALGIAILYAAFGLYILSGGPYENRTIFAMALRLSFWIFFAIMAKRHFQPEPGVKK